MPEAETSMKKLSPSDPITYKCKILIVLKPGVIVSKIISKLRSLGIVKIDLRDNDIELTMTRKSPQEIIDYVENVIRTVKEYIEILCYEVYIFSEKETYELLKRRKVDFIIEKRDDKTIRSVINYDNNYLWLYVNMLRDKFLARRIRAKITNPNTLDPDFISENMFIKCTQSVEETKKLIEKDLEFYENLIKFLLARNSNS